MQALNQGVCRGGVQEGRRGAVAPPQKTKQQQQQQQQPGKSLGKIGKN